MRKLTTSLILISSSLCFWGKKGASHNYLEKGVYPWRILWMGVPMDETYDSYQLHIEWANGEASDTNLS
jgi:hypothetical protein